MRADRPKAFLDLCGQPLLLRAALAFEEAPSVERLVAVVPEDQVATARGILSSLKKNLVVVPGGPRRQDSVLEGLKQAPESFEGVVLVHDAARPLVDVRLIEEVARAAAEVGAGRSPDRRPTRRSIVSVCPSAEHPAGSTRCPSRRLRLCQARPPAQGSPWPSHVIFASRRRTRS